MNDVLNLIKSLNIKKDEIVIVATSGGPDSMMLLSLLHDLKYNLVCAHVNHNVRVESDDEYKFVEDYCKKNNIIFEGTKIEDVPSSNFEQFGRVFRYDFFKTLVDKYHARYIFTAHHGDDLMETILMRMVRGSTLFGYSGFSSKFMRDNYTIIRPLIYLTKDEILEYNKENNIKYVIDQTNFEDEHTRNRFRNHVLPLLKEEDKNVHKKFLKYSNILQDYHDYINKQVYNHLNKMFKDNKLDLKRFKKIDEDLIKKCILEEILRIYYPDNLFLINSSHIDEIIKLINSNNTNINIILPDNLEVRKEYDELIFEDYKFNEGYSYELDKKLDLEIGTIKIVKTSKDTSNDVIRLNSKNIKLPIIVRTRLDGDKIRIKNMKGTKKINDIFIDLKVPKSKRDIYPIVCDSNNKVLWIPGLKKSEFDIPLSGEYDIILKYEKKEK